MDGRLPHRRQHYPLIPGNALPSQQAGFQQQRPLSHLGQQQLHPLHNHSGFGGNSGGPRSSFRPGGPMNGTDAVVSHIGQKRDSSGFHRGPAHPPDSSENVNTKLFVGSVPRNITEDEVRHIFTEYGTVLEVALVKDKRTGMQQGFCFVKYALLEEAERAIKALHNQRILPGGPSYLQVKFANSDRDRSAGFEQKLFVGGLSKQATEKEIEEIFAPFGQVDDVYIIRDEHKQSKGCAFVKLPTKDMATATINALNGVYKMPGCDHPITVRHADPKRPRPEDTRVGVPTFGGPGLSPRSQQDASGSRGVTRQGGLGGSRSPIDWRPMGGPSAGPPHAQGRPFASPDTVQRQTESPPAMKGHVFNTVVNKGVSTINGLSVPHALMAQGGGPGPNQADAFPLPTLTRYGQAGQLGSRVGSIHGSLLSPGLSGQQQQQQQQQQQHQQQQQQQQHQQQQGPFSSFNQSKPSLSQSPERRMAPRSFGQSSPPTQGSYGQPPPVVPASQQFPSQTQNQSLNQAQNQAPPSQWLPPFRPSISTSSSMAQFNNQLLQSQQPPPQQQLFQPPQHVQDLPQLSQFHQYSYPQQPQQQPQQPQLPQQQVYQFSQPPFSQQMQASSSLQLQLQQQSQQLQQQLQQLQQLQSLQNNPPLSVAQMQPPQQLPAVKPNAQQYPQQMNFPQPLQQQNYYQSPLQLSAQPAPISEVPASWSLSVQPQIASTSSISTVAAPAPAVAFPPTCPWTEHTSPDGHKYYYNGTTGESRWEKPEEFIAYEQQLQQMQKNQPLLQTQSQPAPALGTILPAAGTNNSTLQSPGISQVQSTAVIDSLKPVHQGVQYVQDWMLKMKPAGS